MYESYTIYAVVERSTTNIPINIPYKHWRIYIIERIDYSR
jgi:hypothetical protein